MSCKFPLGALKKLVESTHKLAGVVKQLLVQYWLGITSWVKKNKFKFWYDISKHVTTP